MFELLYNFQGLNHSIFLSINKLANHSSIIANILQIISYCFNISNFVIVYFIFCIYFYTQIKKTQDINQAYLKFWPIYNKIILIGIIYTIFGFTYAILKFSVNLSRPFCSLPLGSFITILDVSQERCLSSFPSSHVGLAVLVAYSIWSNITNIQKIMAVFVVTLVAISRISLAIHYPADIIWSFAITIIIIFIGKIIYKIFSNNLIKWFGEIVFKKLFN